MTLTAGMETEIVVETFVKKCKQRNHCRYFGQIITIQCCVTVGEPIDHQFSLQSTARHQFNFEYLIDLNTDLNVYLSQGGYVFASVRLSVCLSARQLDNDNMGIRTRNR